MFPCQKRPLFAVRYPLDPYKACAWRDSVSHSAISILPATVASITPQQICNWLCWVHCAALWFETMGKVTGHWLFLFMWKVWWANKPLDHDPYESDPWISQLYHNIDMPWDEYDAGVLRYFAKWKLQKYSSILVTNVMEESVWRMIEYIDRQYWV